MIDLVIRKLFEDIVNLIYSVIMSVKNILTNLLLIK